MEKIQVIKDGQFEFRRVIGRQKILDLFGDINRDEFLPEPELFKNEYFYRDLEGKYI